MSDWDTGGGGRQEIYGQDDGTTVVVSVDADGKVHTVADSTAVNDLLTLFKTMADELKLIRYHLAALSGESVNVEEV